MFAFIFFMILKNIPKDFHSQFDAVGCFVENKNKEILLLKRHPDKPYGNYFGLLSGKFDKEKESFLYDAMRRELFEETGIFVSEKNKELQFLGRNFVRFSDGTDFKYNWYKLRKGDIKRIKINLEEHTMYQWLTPRNALKLLLIEDLDWGIRKFYVNTQFLPD